MVAVPVVLGSRTTRLRPVGARAATRFPPLARLTPWLSVVAAAIALAVVVGVATVADAGLVADRIDLVGVRSQAVGELDRLGAALSGLTAQVSEARQAVAGLETTLQSTDGFLP